MSKARPQTQRTAEWRARCEAVGEPPGYLVANAVLYAVVEAKRNGEDKVETETLLARAIENVAADERFTVDGVMAVVNRFVQPSQRRRRTWR
jgi:hypothetical protein